MKQYISSKLLQKAEEFRDKIIALRPFPEETLKSLREYYRIDGNGRVARLILNLALIRGEYTIALIPAILRHEYVQSLEISHKNPNVFVDFIAERIIATQLDLLRLLNDGGVNSNTNGGVNNKSGGVNLEEFIYNTIKNNPGINTPAIAEISQKSLRTIQRYLKALSDTKRIEFRGASKNGGYYILK
jgi:Fic family protein